MKLSQEQEQRITDIVEQQEIKITTLREDIIDHLCCVVEEAMGRGKPFDTALEVAIKSLAPQGLKSLEKETIYLLNSKRIVFMKKVIYAIGFLGAAALTTGVLFKLLRWPGADVSFMTGFLLLLLVFVPLLAFDRYKVIIAKALSERLKLIMGASSAIIVGLSGLFKVFHLQGAEFLLMIGTLLFIIGFLPFLFFSMYKKSIT